MSAATAGADTLTRDSLSSAENNDALLQWLGDIGLPLEDVEFFQDFETGFTAGQNIHNDRTQLAGGLIIRDTGPGTPSARVQSSSSYFGGSVPIGNFALAHDEETYLELDFGSRPIDYLSLNDIDHTGTTIRVTFTTGQTFTFSIDGTAASGNSAEFVGIFRNDMPRISKVEMNASGDGEWGIDNLRYGVLPGGPGDVDGDGHVDVVDLLYLVDSFGLILGDGGFDPRCDFNHDDSVDVVDLLDLVFNFGT
jgi:hypothetical protein